MAYYLLDSDAVIDYLGGFAASVDLIRDLHSRGDSLCVCDVVIAEVYSGLNPRDHGKAEGLLSACTFLPTTPPDARLAGQWRYEFARRGKSISTTDALIAATVRTHRAALVTGNVDDYPMEGINILPLTRTRG